MNKLAYLLPLIQKHITQLWKDGVIAVRPGYLTKDNWPTDKPAIIVTVSQTAMPVDLPDQIEGTPVEVRKATDLEELSAQQPEQMATVAAQHPEFRDDAFPKITPPDNSEEAVPPVDVLAAGKPQEPYTPPTGVILSPVTGSFTITCHASPDSGWPTLRDFLSKTKNTLTVGLYDFTSKHILDTVETSLLGAKTMKITLDNPAKNPTADQTDTETLQSLIDDLGPSFGSAWALVKTNKAVPRWIYPNAYHIKVAVRDHSAMWLSSGNWNNSNQPDMDPINHPATTDQALAKKSDRDWHVIIEHPGLAQTYEAYLKHDFDVASQIEGGGADLQEAITQAVTPDILRMAPTGTFQFHAPLKLVNQPMTITPLLTPDPGVYVNAMQKLLQSATHTLYIQLQYIHPPADTDGLSALVDTVVQKIDANLDVRILLSQWQLSNGWLDRLKAAGVSLDHVRIQNGVHNKGFVVDSKIVALGSQNWSSDGVLRNRDASVIINHPKAAQYYEQLFLHDWTRLSKQSM